MNKKISFIIFFTIFLFALFIFTLKGQNGNNMVNRESLFGTFTTTWVFEGSNGVNQAEFKIVRSPILGPSSLTVDYCYYFSFTYPNNVVYTCIKPDSSEHRNFNNRIYRKGTFDIKENILTINFTDIMHGIEHSQIWIQEITIVTMEVESDGRTELYIRQISGKNIFEENDSGKKLKFVASVFEQYKEI